jgi:hypothetical protein
MFSVCYTCAPEECHSFQISVFMNQVECEKPQNYGESVVNCHLRYSLPGM